MARYAPHRFRSRPPARTAGFTLLELIIVVVIIGITTSLAVLAIGDGGRGEKFRREQLRLSGVLSRLREESMQTGRVIGLDTTPTGYAAVFYVSEDWQRVETGERLHRPYELPDGFELEDEVDANAIDIDYARSTPTIVFFPDGSALPATLRIKDDLAGDAVTLAVLDTGALQVEHEGREDR